MLNRRVLKQVGLTVVLSIWGLPVVAEKYPDIQKDRAQCLRAGTAEECRAALPACQRALAALEQAPGDLALHAIRGRVLNNTAWCENQMGNYPAAEGHCRSALVVRQRLYGPEHVDVASSLKVLASVLESQGKYEQAETLFRQALAMRQKLLGAEHVDVASSLNNLAGVLFHQGKHEQAEALFRQLLAMKQKLLGTEHYEVAASLNNLAAVLERQGKYEQAETLFRQALAMKQKLLGTENSDVAASLNNLANVLFHRGKYEQAETLYQQALAMRQRLLGAEHPDVAQGLSNLAAVLSHQSKYEQAETLFWQALAMRKRLLGDEHPDVAASLNNLAVALSHQAKYEQAETLFRQALAILQKLLGAEHPQVAQTLNGLANVLSRRGKHEQAEALYRQTLVLRQKRLGAEHPEVAQTLNNLATVLSRQGKHESAETLHRQALAMWQKLLGAEHDEVASSLNNLAGVLESQGKYKQAETLHRQALVMRQKLLGAEHDEVAESLNNLAAVLEIQGNYESAEMLYRQALVMRQKLLGAEHDEVAQNFDNLAGVLMRRGQFLAALPLFAQAAPIHEKLLRATSSETRMRAALRLVRREEDTLYGLLMEQPTHGPLQRLALTTALLRKGRAAEAGTFANRLLHQSRANRELQERFAQWQQLRQQREALLYGSGGNPSADAYRARLAELSRQADDLESQLGVAMPELRTLQPPAFDAILPAVAARLPRNGVLIEVVWAEPLNFKAMGTASLWAPPHYIAMVLSADQHIDVHDLGEASSVDSQVQTLLAALRNPALEPKNAAQALYNQILKPLLPAKAQHLYLSLDGALSLVPFDALHDGSNYLLGQRSFHYLTSGRDLLRTDAARTEQAALVLADPDFGKAAQFPVAVGAQTFYQQLSTLQRLPGARREAEHIGNLLSSTPLIDAAATEGAVRGAHAPWVLHIASHSLFLRSQALVRPGGRSASLVGARKGVLIGDFETESLGMSGDADSLSRSALVLAGAAYGNQAKSTLEDGLLTAEEARSLELFGTQLVVLSACDTGQGELSAGQGVYGLRRAFLVAGAETLVTSLWQVSDTATGNLMERYYQKLLKENKGRLEGMQEAMKEMRDKYEHPYYWAPFLVFGSDRPLRPPP